MARVLFVILLSTLVFKSYAQEGLPFYTHYLVGDKYLINPSYAGQNPEDFVVNATHKNQWSEVSDAPSTQTLLAHATVIDRLAFGAYFFLDQNGITSKRGFNLTAAYHLPLGEREYEFDDNGVFSFGVGVSNFQQVFDFDRITVIDPNDPVLQDDTYRLTYLNLGISFKYVGFFGGVSVLDIPLRSQPQFVNVIEPLPTWYYLMFGYTFRFGDAFGLEPSFVYNLNGNSESKLDLNLIGRIGFGENEQGLDIGFSYRRDKDVLGTQAAYISPLVKVKIGDFKAGMAYEIGLGDLAPQLGNGFLFSLGYNFANPFNPRFD